MVGLALLAGTVVVGAFTRAYGAGMACGPDWPTCNGQVVPNMTLDVALEYFHRVLAGLAAVALAYASLFLALRGGPARPWALATLATVAAQVALGALVVRFHLQPWLSAAHTSLAVLTVALATGLALRARGGPGV